MHLRTLPLSLYREMHDFLLFSKVNDGKYNIPWREYVLIMENLKGTRATFDETKTFVFQKFQLHPLNQLFGNESFFYINELAAK